MLLDADIREPLFDFLDDYYGKIRILEEKNTGSSRADVVMITETSVVGIEIKSDADTYSRLKSQVRDYDKYYDMNILVCGSTHANHIHEHIPQYWGIITVDEIDTRADFYYLRKPAVNPKMKLERKLSMLWRPEIANIQEKNGMPKYKGKSKEFVIDRIIERMNYPEDKKGYIESEKLMREISYELFERDYLAARSVISQYYKGELSKQIDREEDEVRRRELIDELRLKQKLAKDNGFGKQKSRRYRKKRV